MCRNAEPTRLLTLTVSDKRYRTPQAAWVAMAKNFPELIRYARLGNATSRRPTAAEHANGAKFNPRPTDVEYMRVLELQANGTPHFHCLLRAVPSPR